ncbi:MAG TPA: hypothetical protein VLA88_02320 [Candidatus Saccharimonadales bacterium]|nr:hypothetical protein [Candidatus Saccharimonadales bacterium]
MYANVLLKLLERTWESPVFGNSFSAGVLAKRDVVLRQIGAISDRFAAEIEPYLTTGMPGTTEKEVKKIIAQIAPKTVGFCPALVAGELDDTKRLSNAGVAIGLMYWGDQTMDRGDATMPVAVQLLCGQPVAPELAQNATAQAQLAALRHIKQTIDRLAKPEDAPLVYACYDDQVLLHEWRLHELSQAFLKAKNKEAFLERHGADIARYMIVDAGFPSVASTLYAVYRQHNAMLPSLPDIYAEPAIITLLQICNAVVRVADELGDWQMDAGDHPEWGVFTLNLFNQAHPTLLRAFFEAAGIHNETQIASLTDAFMGFHANPAARRMHGDYIVETFFEHARTYVANLATDTQQTYELYITLCKRVLEIGYVNKIGDIAMGGE